MAEVTLKINGRGYSMTCDDGQEQRLFDLGDFVNNRLGDIARAGAANSESHLLVLTSLVMADEVFELRQELNMMHERMNEMSYQAEQRSHGGVEDEALVVHALNHLAERLERISTRVERAKRVAA